MRWVLAGLVGLSLMASVSADEVKKAVAVGSGVGGVTAVAVSLGTWETVVPHAGVIGLMATGAYLEASTNCADRGLTDHVAQYTGVGNAGNIGKSYAVSEERVKWEVRDNGWLGRKCS